MDGAWSYIGDVAVHRYNCGYCDSIVASAKGDIFQSQEREDYVAYIHICPQCQKPTFFGPNEEVYPEPRYGKPVDGLPERFRELYSEARICASASAYTATVLACKKLLVHIATDVGASKEFNFLQYIEYLERNHYIPPNGSDWVDHVREKGNETYYEIVIMTKQDAEQLLTFVEMLLRFIYEFPSKRLPIEDI